MAVDKLDCMPQGENPFKDLPDRGVSTGLTDTYGSNVAQGFDEIKPTSENGPMRGENLNGC